MHWLALVLIGFAGAYSIFTVGLTGGPSQGDHPFVITIVHCIVFYYYGKHWPALSLACWP